MALQGWQLTHGRGEDPSQEGPETAKEVEQEAVGHLGPLGPSVTGSSLTGDAEVEEKEGQ